MIPTLAFFCLSVALCAACYRLNWGRNTISNSPRHMGHCMPLPVSPAHEVQPLPVKGIIDLPLHSRAWCMRILITGWSRSTVHCAGWNERDEDCTSYMYHHQRFAFSYSFFVQSFRSLFQFSDSTFACSAFYNIPSSMALISKQRYCFMAVSYHILHFPLSSFPMLVHWLFSSFSLFLWLFPPLC